MIINGAGRLASPPTTPPSVEAPPQLLDDAHEQALGAREGHFLQFGSLASPLARDLFRSRIAADLAGYLQQGVVDDGSDASGPLQGPAAPPDPDDPTGPTATSRSLRGDAVVFGFYNNHGIGDCYYACVPASGAAAFFCICIESGGDSDSPYDVYVSAPMEWQAFLAQLPPA